MVSLYNLLFKAWAVVQEILTRVKDIQNWKPQQDTQTKLLNQIIQQQAEQGLLLKAIGEVQVTQTSALNSILQAVTPPPPGPAVGIYFIVSDPQTGVILFEGDSPLQANQSRHSTRHVKVIAKDVDGNVTTLDQADVPTTVVSANAAITIQNLDPATLEFDMVTGALAGVGPISLNGDANLESGAVTQLVGTLDMTVPAGDAVTVEFELGAETPNP